MFLGGRHVERVADLEVTDAMAMRGSLLIVDYDPEADCSREMARAVYKAMASSSSNRDSRGDVS